MGKAVKPIKNIEDELKLIKHLYDRDERVYIYWLIARSGAYRSTEVINLTVGDIKRCLNKGYFDFREQKTGKRRDLPIEAEVHTILWNYVKDKYAFQVLFPSNKGYNQPLTYRQMQRLIKEYGIECGIKNIGTHTPRKSASYQLYIETNGNIEEVKKLLGHERTKDTYRYIDAEEESKLYRIRKTNNPFKQIAYDMRYRKEG